MLPGSVLGLIVGYATQRYGRSSAAGFDGCNPLVVASTDEETEDPGAGRRRAAPRPRRPGRGGSPAAWRRSDQGGDRSASRGGTRPPGDDCDGHAATSSAHRSRSRPASASAPAREVTIDSVAADDRASARCLAAAWRTPTARRTQQDRCSLGDRLDECAWLRPTARPRRRRRRADDRFHRFARPARRHAARRTASASGGSRACVHRRRSLPPSPDARSRRRLGSHRVSGEMSSLARRTGTFDVAAETLDLDGLMAFFTAATPAGADATAAAGERAAAAAAVRSISTSRSRPDGGTLSALHSRTCRRRARCAAAPSRSTDLKMAIFGGRSMGRSDSTVRQGTALRLARQLRAPRCAGPGRVCRISWNDDRPAWRQRRAFSRRRSIP